MRTNRLNEYDFSFHSSESGEQSIEVGAYCICCPKYFLVQGITKQQFQDWVSEEKLIQDIFPEMDSDSREFLISRTCGECFEMMFAEEEK